MLQSDNIVIELRVTAPSFEEEYRIVSFDAEIVDFYDARDLTIPKDPPEWLEEATVFIMLDAELLTHFMLRP